MTDFYTTSGAPSTGSSAVSATIRTEFTSIAAAFAKLAAYTGNGDKLVVVNSAGSGYTVTSSWGASVGGTGATSLTDGGILLGSGTGAITPMAVLADGEIVVGDGVTDPVPVAAFTSSTGTLKHESGGLEFDASAVVDGDFIVGTGTGTFGIESGLTARNSMGVFEHGQCRLDFVSNTQLKLSPFNGNKIIINGQVYEIPAAGITLSNTGAAANTMYYIYVHDNAGTLTLSASTTGHSTDTTAGNVGVEIKTGNSNRTLVGVAYTDSSTPGLFIDNVNARQTLSWFNRKPLPVITSEYQVFTITSTTFTELDTTKRATFLSWGEELLITSVINVSNNTAGAFTGIKVGINGAVDGFVQLYTSTAANDNGCVTAVSTQTVLENVHNIGMFAEVSSGTGSVSSGTTQTCIQG